MRTPIFVVMSVILLVGWLNTHCFANNSEESFYKKGAEYLKEGKFDNAILELSKAIDSNPKLDAAYYDRARAYEAKGDLDRAISDYSKVIEINSIDSIQSAYNNRGLAYEAKGDLDKALENYTKGIASIPDPTFSAYRYRKSVLHRNRANIYLLKGEYDKASKDVREVEKLGGKVDSGFLEKLKNKDSTPQKISDKNKQEKYPGAGNDASFYNNRGYQSFKLGKFDQAIVDYNRALDIEPNVSLIYANRANAYCAKGDFDKAIPDFLKAIEINPNDYNVYHDLGLTYIEKGNFDQAILYLNKALEINSNLEKDGQFHNDRALAFFWKKEYDKCWDDLNKATNLGYRVHPDFLRELKKASGRNK